VLFSVVLIMVMPKILVITSLCWYSKSVSSGKKLFMESSLVQNGAMIVVGVAG